MNEERLGSIGAFAQRLAQHLGEIAEASALPSPAELGRLVELGFFAGLHEEEARRTELALSWTGEAGGCTAAVALSSPVLATPKSVAKLAPAAQMSSTSLAVRAHGDGLIVWALLQHAATRQLPLMMRSLGPGVLRVDYGGRPCALYARGEMLFLDGPHAVRSAARRLTAAFTDWKRDDIDPRAATVTRVAARALSLGHGGMILILPTGIEPRGVRMHYEVGRGADLLADRYARLMEGVPPSERLSRIPTSPPHERAQILYDQGVDFVAGLTGTDNALLLDTDLHVRGFGVQVIESEAPLQPFEHVDPYTGESHVDDISTFKGTRHPAGVIFCLRQQSEAAAIIASQDGRLSLAVKDARGVVEVLGSYERAFGWR